jgi:hypothetical protein
MPCVQRLGGVKVYIYADDENPPHFHVRSAESNAKIRIDNLQIMRGEIKRSEYAIRRGVGRHLPGEASSEVE